jgi:hypothetical protein
MIARAAAVVQVNLRIQTLLTMDPEFFRDLGDPSLACRTARGYLSLRDRCPPFPRLRPQLLSGQPYAFVCAGLLLARWKARMAVS